MLLISKIYAAAQKVPEDFGCRHIKLKYLDDPVDVIVISKPGEERIAKPLFLYCQDSLPKPVIKYSEKGLYEIVPFDDEALVDNFHIIIIGKPFIPIISSVDKLSEDFLFLKDYEKRLPPKGYADRNYLDYYVFRNNAILKQLFKYRWAKTSMLVCTGQGEGSSIAVKMATLNKKITHLIYSAGNPYGKISNQLYESQSQDNTGLKPNQILSEYKKVIAKSSEIQYDELETTKAIFSFSFPQRNNLISLNIPVLVCYKSDESKRIFNDLFQMEVINAGKMSYEFYLYKTDLQCERVQNISYHQSAKWLEWWKKNNKLK